MGTKKQIRVLSFFLACIFWVLMSSPAWAPFGEEPIEINPEIDNPTFHQNQPSLSPQEKETIGETESFDSLLYGQNISNNSDSFYEAVTRLGVAAVIGELASYGRPDSGDDSDPSQDEILSLPNYNNLFVRVPHSFDHSEVSKFLRNNAFLPYLAHDFDRSQIKIALFETDAPTEREFESAIPRSLWADDGAMKVIKVGDDLNLATLSELLSAYSGMTLIVIGHIEVLDSSSYVELPGKLGDREQKLVSLDDLNRAAQNNGVNLVMLGCATGGYAHVGTSSPNGEISSLDAVRNISQTLHAKPRTMGEFLNGIGDDNYTMQMMWTMAQESYNASLGHAAIIEVSFQRKNTPGALCDSIRSESTCSYLVQPDSLPVPPPPQSTDPEMFGRSIALSGWTSFVLFIDQIGQLLFILSALGILVSLFLIAVYFVGIIKADKKTDQRPSFVQVLSTFLVLFLGAPTGAVISLGLCAPNFPDTDSQLEPLNHSMFFYFSTAIVCLIFVLLCVVPVIVSRDVALKRKIPPLKDTLGLTVFWLLAMVAFSVGPLRVLLAVHFLDVRYLDSDMS